MADDIWLVAYATALPRDVLGMAPEMDRAAAQEFLRHRFPKDRWKPLTDGRLSSTAPPKREALVAAFPGLTVLSARDFALPFPSRIESSLVTDTTSRSTYFVGMHRRYEWAAFALWENGSLVRSVSMTSRLGVVEELGSRLRFEDDYWSSHPPLPPPRDRPDNAPLPRPPFELGQAALQHFFGFRTDEAADDGVVAPESIALARYRRSRRWWWS